MGRGGSWVLGTRLHLANCDWVLGGGGGREVAMTKVSEATHTSKPATVSTLATLFPPLKAKMRILLSPLNTFPPPPSWHHNPPLNCKRICYRPFLDYLSHSCKNPMFKRGFCNLLGSARLSANLDWQRTTVQRGPSALCTGLQWCNTLLHALEHWCSTLCKEVS